MSDQIIEQVSVILAEAGFTPMPQGVLAGVYCAPNGAGNYVFGGVHEGAGEVHAWDPGLNLTTTNNPIEAAQNLAAYIARKLAAAVPIDGDTREAEEGSMEPPEPILEPDAALASEPIDAEYFAAADLPALEAPELSEELASEHPQEYGAGAFIFGDNLDQQRTAAIGIVNQFALSLMPEWSAEDETELVSLRNYALGVNELGWPHDEARAARLDDLEATQGRLRLVEQAMLSKVRFLNTASRDELAAFDPEAGWP